MSTVDYERNKQIYILQCDICCNKKAILLSPQEFIGVGCYNNDFGKCRDKDCSQPSYGILRLVSKI